MATNVAKPTSANLPNLSAIPVPVDYSQPTGLALMLADMIVSGRKVVSYLRQISTANFISGAYSFPTPPDYTPAPYRLPMLEPVSWNVVADIVTAYQPVEVYQIGSTTDLMQSTFPIIINPTDYTSDAGVIKPLDVGQSVVIRVYKVASAGINWAGSNIVNNGLTDEAIKSLTQITMVVTNVAGVYTVTDWLGVNFLTNGMSSLKTSAKGNFAAVINELFDAIAAKTATGAAGGDLTGTYPNPTIGDGKVTPVKLDRSYLPLAGGTMTGDIKFESGKGLVDAAGRRVVALYGTTAVYLGTSEITSFILWSTDVDLTHSRAGNFYKIWDAANLPSPLQSGDIAAWAKAATKPAYDFYEINDFGATRQYASGTIIRKVITGGTIPGYGYTSRASLGTHLQGNGFAPAVLGVGTNDAGTAFMDFYFYANGQLHAPGGFFQSSDERLKDFLGDMVIDWEALKRLPKSFYRLKNDPENRVQIGTSAQALKEVFPELVSVGSDGFYSVDYARLSVVALSAACELQDRVTSLETRLARLEAKLSR